MKLIPITGIIEYYVVSRRGDHHGMEYRTLIDGGGWSRDLIDAYRYECKAAFREAQLLSAQVLAVIP